MSDLAEALWLSYNAHDGQTDKGGRPYFLHPIRVMLAQTDERCRIAAVLHDVVEDTDIGLQFILMEYGQEIHDAVDALTRRAGEDYFDYIRRCMANPIARSVKIADLKDNMDPSRKGASDSLIARYQRALAMIEGNEGDENGNG